MRIHPHAPHLTKCILPDISHLLLNILFTLLFPRESILISIVPFLSRSKHPKTCSDPPIFPYQHSPTSSHWLTTLFLTTTLANSSKIRTESWVSPEERSASRPRSRLFLYFKYLFFSWLHCKASYSYHMPPSPLLFFLFSETLTGVYSIR